jgi:hypothetical protein
MVGTAGYIAPELWGFISEAVHFPVTFGRLERFYLKSSPKNLRLLWNRLQDTKPSNSSPSPSLGALVSVSKASTLSFHLCAPIPMIEQRLHLLCQPGGYNQ